VGSTPVPDKLTVCWLFFTPLLLSVTVNVPVNDSLSCGEKVTVITQFLSDISEEGALHVSVSEKAEFDVVEILGIDRAPVPVLVSVTVNEAVVDTRTLPNDRLVGDRLPVGVPLAPVPVKLTV